MMLLNLPALGVLIVAAGVGAISYALGLPWVPGGIACFFSSFAALAAGYELVLTRRGWTPPRLFWIVPAWYGGLLGLAVLARTEGMTIGVTLLLVCGYLALRFLKAQSRLPGGDWLLGCVGALGVQIILEMAADLGYPVWGHEVIAVVLGVAIIVCAYMTARARSRPRATAPVAVARARPGRAARSASPLAPPARPPAPRSGHWHKRRPRPGRRGQ